MSTTKEAATTPSSSESAPLASEPFSLSRVLEKSALLLVCTSYQDGDAFLGYCDGDNAAAQGHLGLIKLKSGLLEQSGGEKCARDCTSRDSGAAENSDDWRGGDSTRSEGEDVHDDGRTLEEGTLLANAMRFSHCAVDWAATQGHTEVVRWLLQNRSEGCTENAVDGACWNGHESTVHWLADEWGQMGSERAVDYAASTGRLELVKWLSRRGARCTLGAMDGAAGGGHLDVVSWLAANRSEGCSQAAFDMAAAEGHLYILEWLDEAGSLRCSSTGLDSAAEGGHVHVLQWMLERKPACCCTSNAYGLAASRGRLEVLQWLRRAMPQLGCPNWAVETAAAAGHVEVMRWLHATGVCRASLAVLDDVAAQGQLDALSWLSERGAGASEGAVDRAAEAGHAEVVEYLLKTRIEGCSSEAIIAAARNGHLRVVKLLRELRPDCGCCLTARVVAEASGYRDVAKWLDDSHPGLVQTLEEAVAECSISGGCSSNDNDDDT